MQCTQPAAQRPAGTVLLFCPLAAWIKNSRQLKVFLPGSRALAWMLDALPPNAASRYLADSMISCEPRQNLLPAAPSQAMKLSPLCTRLLGSTPFLKLLVACKHDLKAMPIISSKINQLTFTNALAALDRRVSGKWVLSDIGAAVKCGMREFVSVSRCLHFCLCLLSKYFLFWLCQSS